MNDAAPEQLVVLANRSRIVLFRLFQRWAYCLQIAGFVLIFSLSAATVVMVVTNAFRSEASIDLLPLFISIAACAMAGCFLIVYLARLIGLENNGFFNAKDVDEWAFVLSVSGLKVSLSKDQHIFARWDQVRNIQLNPRSFVINVDPELLPATGGRLRYRNASVITAPDQILGAARYYGFRDPSERAQAVSQ